MTLCENCNSRLDNLKEIVACNGLLFCNRQCAISKLSYDIRERSIELAREEYEETAEIISPKDAGIMPEHLKQLIEFVQYSQGCSEKLATSIAVELLEEVEELVEEKLEDLKDE